MADPNPNPNPNPSEVRREAARDARVPTTLDELTMRATQSLRTPGPGANRPVTCGRRGERDRKHSPPGVCKSFCNPTKIKKTDTTGVCKSFCNREPKLEGGQAADEPQPYIQPLRPVLTYPACLGHLGLDSTSDSPSRRACMGGHGVSPKP